MTFRELYNLAPVGKTIAYSDGTPRPASRFTRKVKDWEKRNGSGVFKESHPGYAACPDSESVGLLTHSGPILQIIRRFGPRSGLTFTIV